MTEPERAGATMIAGAVVIIFLSLAAKCLGGWTTVQPVRQARQSGLLGELESRMPTGHIYRDLDIVTWAHETTHGLNSRVRNQYSGTGRHNAFYVPGGKACVLCEPSGVTLSAVARAVPSRGSLYSTYLVQQQRYWNNEPLYLCDELAAYANGAYVGLQYGRHDRAAGSLRQAREMRGYCGVMCGLAERAGNDVEGLRGFLAWMDKYLEFLQGEVER